MEIATESIGNNGNGPYYDTTVLSTIDDSYHYEEYGLSLFCFMDVWWSIHILDTYAAENKWTINMLDSNIRQVLYWNRPLYSKIFDSIALSSLAAGTVTVYDLYSLTYKGVLCEKITTMELSVTNALFNTTAFTLDGVNSYNTTNLHSNCWDAYPLQDPVAAIPGLSTFYGSHTLFGPYVL
jgi:hypothetical protein